MRKAAGRARGCTWLGKAGAYRLGRHPLFWLAFAWALTHRLARVAELSAWAIPIEVCFFAAVAAQPASSRAGAGALAALAPGVLAGVRAIALAELALACGHARSRPQRLLPAQQAAQAIADDWARHHPGTALGWVGGAADAPCWPLRLPHALPGLPIPPCSTPTRVGAAGRHPTVPARLPQHHRQRPAPTPRVSTYAAVAGARQAQRRRDRRAAPGLALSRRPLCTPSLTPAEIVRKHLQRSACMPTARNVGNAVLSVSARA